jgi:hypothetical protein
LMEKSKNSALDKKSSREEELVSHGWAKQFCATGSRIQEAAELYESMGLEVLREPLRIEDLDCSQCFEGPSGSVGDCVVIYTRPLVDRKEEGQPGGRKRDEDLW